MRLRDFEIFIDALRLKYIVLDTEITALALLDLNLVPNSSWRFNVELETPREERPCPYLRQSDTYTHIKIKSGLD